jgi:hypothetical protein
MKYQISDIRYEISDYRYQITDRKILSKQNKIEHCTDITIFLVVLFEFQNTIYILAATTN